MHPLYDLGNEDLNFSHFNSLFMALNGFEAQAISCFALNGFVAQAISYFAFNGFVAQAIS